MYFCFILVMSITRNKVQITQYYTNKMTVHPYLNALTEGFLLHDFNVCFDLILATTQIRNTIPIMSVISCTKLSVSIKSLTAFNDANSVREAICFV